MILKADAVPYGSQLSEEMKAEVARLVEQAQYEGVQLTGVLSWVGNAIVRVRRRVRSTSRGAETHS